GARRGRGIRIVLADDHRVVREGLRLILEGQSNLTVVGEAANGRQALEIVERLHPDVVVMDVTMPELNGIEATRQITRRFPGTKVLALTMQESERYVRHIVKVGAAACVLKSAAGTELAAAVRAVAAGESYFSPAIASVLLTQYRSHVAES